MSDLCKCGHAEDHHFTPRLGGRCFRHECECVAFEAPNADRDDLAAIVAQATDCMDCEGTGKDVVRFDKDMNPVEWGTCHRCGAVASMVLESDWLRERDAEKWAEGRNAGVTDMTRVIGWGVGGCKPDQMPSDMPNPYRADRVDAEDGGR